MTLQRMRGLTTYPQQPVTVGSVWQDGRCFCCDHHRYIIVAIVNGFTSVSCYADVIYTCKCHHMQGGRYVLCTIKDYHKRLF